MVSESNSSVNFRSDCPISSSLDLVGDKWSLLILRDMMIDCKKTFKDFSTSKEGIATNILSKRLASLEAYGIIGKFKMPNNKKTNIYQLTPLGIDLIPVVIELALWTHKHSSSLQIHFDTSRKEQLTFIAENKNEAIQQLKDKYVAQLIT